MSNILNEILKNKEMKSKEEALELIKALEDSMQAALMKLEQIKHLLEKD